MKTAMQDLKEDLTESFTTTKNSLLEVKDVKIREACQEVVRLTLENIIKRIDEELLPMERQQIEKSFADGFGSSLASEEYYEKTFKN